LTLDPAQSAALEFMLEVERLYAALAGPASQSTAGEPSLGGKLLYAGELEPHGRTLLVAGNIAGAASLAVSADQAAQKQAIRDGVADFLVNSLDEALRILKNEIRKGETVAVCIAGSPHAIESEMEDRGVMADLLEPLSVTGAESPASFALDGQACVIWSVSAAPAFWLPKLDAIATDCLLADSSAKGRAGRRWIRLAPRYLGRMARGLRMMRCEMDVAKDFVARVQCAVDCGEIGAGVQISVTSDGETVVFNPLLKLKT
jgi:urocanase-like protein